MVRPPTRVENAALLSLGGLGYGALLFVWFALPASLQPIIDELGLTGTQAGILAGAVPLTYIPIGLASGLVVDRLGARVGVGAGVALAGVAQVGRAYAPGFASMLALTLVLGVGATGITFGMPKLASELYPSDRVGRAASVYLIGSYAGSASVFATGRSILVPALGGWRPLFLASGLGTLGVAAVWAAAAWHVPPGSHETDDQGTFSLASLTDDLRAVLGHRDLRLLVLLGTMYLFVLHGTQGWLVTILERRGVDPGLAGSVTSLLVVGQTAGVLAVPVVAERLDRKRESLVVCGVLSSLGAVGLLAEPAVVLLLVVPVVLVGFGMGGLSPLIRAIPVELDGIGPGLTGTAVGMIFAVGEIGGFLGPVVIGALRDATGSFTPGLLFVAVGALVAAGAGAAMSELD
ncbi:MFS transporter [Natronomonas salina]|uniref:MFS transporter n=1 Tax=Natronomonas salina TaxID=1710540 RepID=UPI0015B76658|nr:MFS transporter [Natronomonas salina]QLD90257.1 MFS transporter [Natronomonas salina]